MQEKNLTLKTPVRYFKGVGPKKSGYLSRIGISTAEDLLYYLPKRYEDRSKFTAIRDIRIGEYQTLKGEIMSLSSRIAKNRTHIIQVAIKDRTGAIHATWYNQPYLKNCFKNGQKIILYGRVELFDKVQVVQPEYEIVESDQAELIHIGRIAPIYSLTSLITQKYLRALVFQAVSKYRKYAVERLPAYILAHEKLVDLKYALANIHFPSAFDSLERAYRRIVFEEFFMLQLALAMKRKEVEVKADGLRMNPAGELVDSFKNTISFEFTDGQKNAIADIERDMAKGSPMNRLLEGDVGSGKTVVAAHAIVLSVQNGFQAVLMAPTEILARQHFLVLSELLMPLGINLVLLVSGIGADDKERVYSDIRTGVIDIVVGTHAVIQESVEFKNLGLAVIDEQHKFGVAQRSLLRQKGYDPHLLVMTATPIPRTLAMTVYGDLDISTIKELPKGRKPVITYWVEEDMREDIYEFMRGELKKGRQAYVVCPVIEKTQNSKLKTQKDGEGLFDRKTEIKGATELFEKFKNQVFSDFNIGLLHGRMDSKEKESVMKDFKKGKINILVSTIVIEVGIDVPKATVMLVENAERFGLAQLHQLRGRVGRSDIESYFLLLANPKTDEAIRRLKVIEGSLDGFQIAEEDLNIRGPGEFFGTRQHGLPEIRFGDIVKDFNIMERARIEAQDIISRDPELREERHRLVKENLLSRFKDRFGLLKAG